MSQRIVIDATPLLYPANGIGRATRELLRSMLALDHPYEIALFGRRLQGERLSDQGFGVNSVHVRLPRFCEAAIKQLRLVNLLCRGDLYHATDFYMPVYTARPMVATLHDAFFLTHPEMIDHVRLARQTPEFARRCQVVITDSEYSKSELIRVIGLQPDLVRVVYLGVDGAWFRPEPDPQCLQTRLADRGLTRPYFLTVSCSDGRKNTPQLLEAYRSLLTRDPQSDLVLTWSPPPELRERYAELAASGRVHFLGRQSDADLRDLYCGATALVFPSLREGFGFPILEAMSCGTPVITSNVSSLPEVGGDAAWYFDPGDETSLLSALEVFENRDPRIADLSQRGLSQAAKFTWDRAARETLAVYESCLA